MSPQTARRSLYPLGAAAFRDRLLLGARVEDAAEVNGLLALADTWPAPLFPLDGAAIKAAGVAEGPEVGRVRREVEAWWIAQDFPENGMALQAALQRAIVRLEG